MRVVMVDPSLFTGRYDDALCAALAAAGHEVTLAARPMRATDAIVPAGYRYAPRFFALAERVPTRLRAAVKALTYAADAVAGSLDVFAGAQVLHWQWLPLAVADGHWLRRLRARHALVHTVHNARPFHDSGGKEAAQARGYFDRIASFDALIVHGAATRDALLARGVTAPIHVVPHPPMRLAPPGDTELAAVPPGERPRILFFGTIKPYKGVDLLVDAALTLWSTGLDFDLAIAGQPFMPTDALFGGVRAAGFGDRLILDLGFLTEGRLTAHLTRADIVVFPYRHIDSSGAFLSALGYGAAMVTSDCGMFGGLPGESVARFQVGDGRALVDILRGLLTSADERARLAVGAAALGAAMGSWAEAARLTAAAYDDALDRARQRGVQP